MHLQMKSGNAEKAFKGVGDLFVGQIGSKVFTFLFLVIFVRLLSQEELAILPLYYATSGAATLLFSFGIPATLTREVPRLRESDSEKMHSLLFTAFVVVMTGIFISAFLIYLLEEPIRELFLSDIGHKIQFKLLACAMLVGGWKTFLTFLLKALQMYRRMAIFGASNDLLYRVFGLVGFVIEGINGMLAGFLLGTLIINIFCTWRIAPILFGERKWYPILELLNVSWPFYFESYLHYFRSHGDTLIISALLGSSSLSILFVAKRLYDLMMTITVSMEHVMAPSLSQLLGNSLEVAFEGYLRMMTLIPLATIPMGLFAAVLSYAFIDVVGGSDYAEKAYLPAALYCGVIILHSLAAIKISAIYVFGLPTDRLKITASQFVVYFLSLYLLVKEFGILGAPVAQAISYIAALKYTGYLLSKIKEKVLSNNLVWIILWSTLVGSALLIGLQVYYYSILMIPIYIFAAIILQFILVSILTPVSEFLKLKKALPSQLERPFAAYMDLRTKILGEGNSLFSLK